jgi:putative ABC transport system permease protein
MSGLAQDFRYAVRQFRRNPGFLAVAVITLALGIGANTAIFTLVDQVLLRSLPVKDAHRLVVLRFSGSDSGHVSSRTDEHFYFSYPMYRDLRDRNSVFDGVIATDWVQAGVQWHDQPDLISAELVSGNYFDVLGVQAAMGRLFVTADDIAPNANPIAVLSFNYWQRRFGGDQGIVNQSILVNGYPFTVVGVVQKGFHSAVMGDTPQIFVPITMEGEVIPGSNDLEERRSRWLNIMGRLKPSFSREQAEAGIASLWYSIRSDELKEMASTSEHFRKAFLTQSHLSLLKGDKGLSPLRSDTQTPLTIIMAMVGLVAIMACANVGSLLLVRAAGRMREMSVRYALGAKRQRVLRQLLVEGLLLGVCGGGLGLCLAPGASALLIRMMWTGTAGERPVSPQLDTHTLIFTLSLVVLVSLLFSLAPSTQFWHPNVISDLKQQASAASGPLRLRRISVVVQLALSLLLLVGAGLFVRTLHSLKSVDVGFASDHLLTFGIDPALAGYQPSQDSEVTTRVLQTLAALPGVRSAAATTDPELADNSIGGNIKIAGYTEKENEDMNVERPWVSPGYFSTMGMSLLAGRELNEQDVTGTQKVAVVNESFAIHYLGDPQHAIGHYFGHGGGDVRTDVQIVGVVKDAKHTGVRRGVRRTVFTPYLQESAPNGMTFYVRTWQAPETLEVTVRRAMQKLDSKLVLNNFRTMQEQIEDNLSAERMIALLASSFGALAVFMAAIGLYGVIAYSTAQRTREIGLRIALGAARSSIVRMVFIEVLTLTGISVAIALPLSLLLAHVVHNQLFGISSNDPLTLVLGTGLIAAVALASAFVPARRAANVEPMVALHYE